jgi:hypothetical protein
MLRVFRTMPKSPENAVCPDVEQSPQNRQLPQKEIGQVTQAPESFLVRTVRISDDAVFRALGEEAVVLNLASGTYYGLNAVGLRIWELVEQGASLETVRATIVGEFDVDADTAARDLQSLIETLSSKGLVVLS